MASEWVFFGYVLREDDEIFYVLQANELEMDLKLITN